MRKHLTAAELGDRLRKSTGTLANWRVAGKGPKWIKSGKSVLYPIEHVEAYEASNTHGSTASYELGKSK